MLVHCLALMGNIGMALLVWLVQIFDAPVQSLGQDAFAGKERPLDTLAIDQSASALNGAGEQGSWNFIRGEHYDGNSAETGLLSIWPDRGPPVVWHRDLGQGYSSFTGRNGRIFTQYQSMTGQYLICLQALTGETLWEYQHSWPFDPTGLYPGPQSTPTLDEQWVYFTTPQGRLVCVAQADGQLKWQVDLWQRFNAPQVEFGYSCSPVVIGELLYLPVGGPNASMVALSVRDGSTVWQSGNEPISHASALPIQYRGRRLVVGYLKNAIQLYDAADGEVLSTLMLSEGYDEHSAWPIYREPFLWFSGPFRAGSMWIEIVGDPQPTLELKRESELLSNDVCSSILVGDHLFGFDLVDVQSKVHRPSRGLFRCLEFASGRERWSNGSLRERRRLLEAQEAASDEVDTPRASETSPTVGHAAVIQADGKLIMLNDVGELVLAWADPVSYREIGRSRVLGGSICWTQPMLLDGLVYVRDHSRVVCVALKDLTADVVNVNQLTTVDELPVVAYRDWAAWILAVEPEYAMTAPTPAWLLRWYVLTSAMGWIVAPAVAGVLVAGMLALGFSWNGWRWYDVSWQVVAFSLGLVGTTLISAITQEFEFTWPLSLAVAFQWVVMHMSMRRGEPVARPWLARGVLLLFAVLLLSYFLLCRRLSLAFEWSFLVGFPAALPFLLIDKVRQPRAKASQLAARWFWTLLAYSAFYWLGAGLMMWRYRG
jgi:outer membrane protein assembly factor BamB